MITVILDNVFRCYFFLQNRQNTQEENRGGQNGRDFSEMATMVDGVMSYGVTSIGISQVDFEVENLATQLEIEEVYVASDQEVEEGTAILKLSEDSLQEAREELEQVLKEADLAFRAGTYKCNEAS